MSRRRHGTVLRGSPALLLSRAEELAQLGIWQWCPTTSETHWSDNLFRIIGLEPGEIDPSPEWVVECTHPDDREHVQSYLGSMSQGRAVAPIEFRVVLPPSGARRLRSQIALSEDSTSGSKWFSGVVQDITEQAWAERQAAVHAAVARATIEWDSFERGATRLLSGLGEALEFQFGVLWLPTSSLLRARAVWQSRTLSPDLLAAIQKLRLGIGQGLAGRAWNTRQPLIIRDIALDHSYQPRETALQAGLRSAVAVPLLRGEEVVAVLSFVSRTLEHQPSGTTDALVSIGAELGTFLGRRRGQLAGPALSPRDLEILTLASNGLSGHQVAERLGISPSTVKSHFEQIYRKLRVSDRAAAVAQGLRSGLID